MIFGAILNDIKQTCAYFFDDNIDKWDILNSSEEYTIIVEKGSIYIWRFRVHIQVNIELIYQDELAHFL